MKSHRFIFLLSRSTVFKLLSDEIKSHQSNDTSLSETSLRSVHSRVVRLLVKLSIAISTIYSSKLPSFSFETRRNIAFILDSDKSLRNT